MSSYSLPHYILNADLANYPIDYSWDIDDLEKDFDNDAAIAITEKIEHISLRAKLALMTGVYEWVLGRLMTYSQHDFFIKIVEAAWCANINKLYLITESEFENSEYVEENNYTGPIDGVLWYASITGLFRDLYVSSNTVNLNNNLSLAEESSAYYTDSWRNDLRFLIALTTHILPPNKTDLFKSWLNNVVNRLIEYYTMPEEDPFANIFEYKDDKEWLGDYIAREFFDPSVFCEPKDAIKLCGQYLQQVDHMSNPFLRSPNDLLEKIQHPYQACG